MVMHWNRLSSALTLAGAWLRSKQSLARELQQALAEVRRLKATVREAERRLAVDQHAWRQQADEGQADHNRLAAVIAQQERELSGKDHEIAQLTSQVQLDRLEIAGQSRINTALMADLDKIIAQRVADASRAATNGHTTSGIENLL